MGPMAIVQEEKSVFSKIIFFQWVSCIVHRIHKYFIYKKKKLKLGLTILFTHLKIILLQCFQFSVFSNKQYPNRPLVTSLGIIYSLHAGHMLIFKYIIWNIGPFWVVGSIMIKLEKFWQGLVRCVIRREFGVL